VKALWTLKLSTPHLRLAGLDLHQALLLPAHELDELVVDDLDQLLVGAHALQHLHPQRRLLHAPHEPPDHRQAHLSCFKQ
jgi:hypothetical protein